MKNISIFINTLSAAGGTQRVLTSLVNLLADKFNITIIILDNKASFFKIRPEIKIKKIVSTKSFVPLKLIDFNLKIYKELRQNSCDFYISLDSNSVLMQSLFLPQKTKLIVWEHFSLSKNFNKILYKISRYYASKRAYQFVLLSKQEIKDWGMQYNIPQSKMSLIYNPITIDENLSLRNTNLFDNKKLLAIGNNVHVKGFDYLIQAWSLLKPNGWSLDIVGLSEKEQVKLKHVVDTYKPVNQVNIMGKVSNIEEKYLNSSIYCLCSRMEATPLVLIESQYIGLPAIVFDNCEGPLELLNNSGLIVDFDDVNKYADAIDKLINSKPMYQELSNNARLNSQRFNNQAFYEKWCDVLN